MKKFSNISNYKVQSEPKQEVKQINEEDLFKAKVLQLLDEILAIRTYGPIQRYFNSSSIKIAGKEMFVEALVDLMKDKSLKEESKILESLKSTIGDWQILDSKIDELNQKMQKNTELSKVKRQTGKLKDLYESYKDDSELLMTRVDESCKKITKSETALLRSQAALELSNQGYPKDLFLQISEKFDNRHKQLSNEE